MTYCRMRYSPRIEQLPDLAVGRPGCDQITAQGEDLGPFLLPMPAIDEYELSELRQKFRSNIAKAKSRGIGWELTLTEWIDLWKDHIHLRGTKRGGYVLCRKDDKGPYAVGNCYVGRHEHNSSVRGYKETRTPDAYE